MRKIYLFTLLSFLFSTAHAQDVHFSQISHTPLLVNPASAGFYDGYYRAILNYRNQWSSMGKGYSTFMGSFDMPFYGKKMKPPAYIGLGVYVFSDKAGDARLSTTTGDVSLSCIVPLNAYNKLSAGIEAGITFRSVDLAAIQWPNQYNGSAYDPSLPSNESGKMGSYFYFDMGIGLNYQYLKPISRFYGRDIVQLDIGAAMFHAAKMFQSIDASNRKLLYPRIVFNTSLRYDLRGTKLGIVPSVLYMKQGPAYELGMGLLLRYRLGNETNYTGFFTESAFSFGVMYRYKDAIIPQLFFEVSNFGIGLSYDVNISSFASSLGYKGGLEVSIKYSKLRGALYKNWK